MSISQAYENRGFVDDKAIVPEVVEDGDAAVPETWEEDGDSAEAGAWEAEAWGQHGIIEEEEEPLTEEEKTEFLEQVTIIRDNLQAFYRVGKALKRIREQRLYRERYVTFEEFCQEHMDLSKTHVNRYISGANVMEDLTPIGVILPKNEAQARPLTLVKSSDRRAMIWVRTLERADKEGVKVTAKLVEEMVGEYIGKPDPEPREDRAERERRLMDMASTDFMAKHRSYVGYINTLASANWAGCPKEAVIAHLKTTIEFIKKK